MRVYEGDQGSEEWIELHTGRITASRFADVLAKPDTKRYREYMDDLIRGLHGIPSKYYGEEVEPWFEHGRALETFAIGAYEWKYDVTVSRPMFVVHPKYDYIACSPDGLVEREGKHRAIEVKARALLRTYRQAVTRERPESVYRWQIQGQLWCMQGIAETLDYVNYYRREPEPEEGQDGIQKLHVSQVEPDPKDWARIEEACLRFMERAVREFKEWQ